MAAASLNDVIQSALDPVYHGGDVTTNLHLWMIAVGISPWSIDAIRAYIIAIHPHLSVYSTNEVLYFYFDGFTGGTSFRLLEDGSFRLLEDSIDVRLLEV